jgi:peptidoglycan/xylan/chitin deacetylase (PgdA/CDA1 family)
MREAGWFPVNLRDILDRELVVPAGKTPVVITFDDARASQFRYEPDGSTDPDCAVGILEEFHRRYPDEWPLRATFFVMPESKWNPAPFHQTRFAAQKLRYLLEHGFEIANHSTTHRSMTRMDARALQWEIAESIRGIRKLAPKATMDTLALPYGEEPRDKNLRNLLIEGVDHGTSYANRAVAIAWGGPAYSLLHKRFDRRSLTRIGVEPGSLERWIVQLKTGKLLEPYVSDGETKVTSAPRSSLKWLNRKALRDRRLIVWNDLPAKEVPKVARRTTPRHSTH